MTALIRGLLFTIVVPGMGALGIPWWILTDAGAGPLPAVAGWPAIGIIALGLGLYGWCLWLFAIVGSGTPGPWDAPRRVVAVGPYRWVRNPIYLAALMVITGEAWLFASLALLEYAVAMAVTVHLFVLAYEEPTLQRSFGDTYLAYRRSVPRWLPRPPRIG